MKHLLLSVLVLLLTLNGAKANYGPSTINPMLPVQGSPLTSLPVRNNFQSAYNDITNIYSILNGFSPAPSTPLTVANGGTGGNSLLSGAFLVGNGTSPVTFLAVGASGNCVLSNGTAWQSGLCAQGVNVKNYGAVGNTVGNPTASLTLNSKTVGLSGLTSADVGKLIQFMKSNTTNTFQSTITGVGSSTITVADNATFTATSVQAYYGANDTTAIDNAQIVAQMAHTCLYFPASSVGTSANAVGAYFYNGNGATTWDRPCIHGDGQENSIVVPGVGKYLFDGDTSTAILTGIVRDMGFVGGEGAIRSRATATNVHFQFMISHVNFSSYSGAAVTFNYTDFPEVNITESDFNGLNSSSSMGIAMASCGPCFFYRDAFGTNRYHYKLGTGEWVIDGNDFVQGNAETTPGSIMRANIWAIPSASSAAISGKVVNTKFGNENLDIADARVLLADTNPNSGTSYFGDTLPTGSASTGFAPAFLFSNNSVNGSATTGSGFNPIFYTYTPNFINFIINGTLNGTAPGYIVQFDSSILPLGHTYQASGTIGPFNVTAAGVVGPNGLPIQVTNAGVPIATVIDPTGNFGYNDSSVIPYWTTGASIETELLTTRINSFSFPGGSSHTQITDSAGGTDAVTYTSSNPNDQVIGALSSTPANGTQNWCYAELRQGSSGTSASFVWMAVVDSFGTPQFQHKLIVLSPNWAPYWMPWALTQTPAHTPPHLVFFTNSGTPSGDTVDIARPRCYSAQQPLSGPYFDLPVGIGTAAPGAMLDVNGNSLIIESSNTPADNATCTAGTIWWDTGFIYVCTASGTVKRSTLSTY